MCLIVDANVAPLVFASARDHDFKPVQEALVTRKAVAVYGGQLRREYLKIERMRGILAELDRQGSLRQVPDVDVDQVTQAVADEGLCVSNDLHIVALARVSATRLLCSQDKDLHVDFTNPKVLKPAGSVYQDKSHIHLIRKHCGKVGRLSGGRRAIPGTRRQRK